jgi:hypothetical protein
MRYLIFVVLVVVGFVAYYRGWFELSANNGPDNAQSTASVTINKKKIQNDVNEFAEKTRQQVSSITHPQSQAKPNAAEATARGQVDSVAQGKLTLRMPDDQLLSFGIVPKTEVRIGDRLGTMADLHKDDPVSVVYTDDEDRHVAVSVTVENRQ